MCVCTQVCGSVRVYAQEALEGGGSMLTITFPCCQDQSVSGKLMENTKPI